MPTVPPFHIKQTGFLVCKRILFGFGARKAAIKALNHVPVHHAEISAPLLVFLAIGAHLILPVFHALLELHFEFAGKQFVSFLPAGFQKALISLLLQK